MFSFRKFFNNQKQVFDNKQKIMKNHKVWEKNPRIQTNSRSLIKKDFRILESVGYEDMLLKFEFLLDGPKPFQMIKLACNHQALPL